MKRDLNPPILDDIKAVEYPSGTRYIYEPLQSTATPYTAQEIMLASTAILAWKQLTRAKCGTTARRASVRYKRSMETLGALIGDTEALRLTTTLRQGGNAPIIFWQGARVRSEME